MQVSDDVKNSILVIDDENANIIKLTHILGSMYTIYASKNGMNGIKLAKSNLPDVILLDILMPDMDGYEVLSVLKSTEETKDIPVVFITGLTGTVDEEKGLSLGAADYITKPFNDTIVKLRVHNQISAVNQTRLKIEKEAAEQNSKAKTEFLSRVSHEMLTPMNAIMGMMQLARMSNPPSELSGIFDEIDTASSRLLELINDMLDTYAIEKGTFRLDSSRFSFDAMIGGILSVTGLHMEYKGQIFFYEPDNAIPDALIGDEYRLAQVIQSLLMNASNFTPDGGDIRMSVAVVSRDAETVTMRVEITDSGIGISSKQRDDIFKIFGQADVSETRRVGGMGLGLTISKTIVEQMGGAIWFESEPGKGTTFMFTFNAGL